MQEKDIVDAFSCPNLLTVQVKIHWELNFISFARNYHQWSKITKG